MVDMRNHVFIIDSIGGILAGDKYCHQRRRHRPRAGLQTVGSTREILYVAHGRSLKSPEV